MKPMAQHVIFVHRLIILDRWDRECITNDLVDREFVSEHLIELALRGCSRPPFNEVTSGGFWQHLGKIGCRHDWNGPQACKVVSAKSVERLEGTHRRKRFFDRFGDR